MPVSAVFFDLDGTLVDSLPDLSDAVNHMLTSFGRPLLNQTEIQNLIGKGARNLVQRALDTSSSEKINRGLEIFSDFNELHIADKSRLYPGIRETLQKLASSNIRMAVISNKNEYLCRLILKELKVDTFFECVAGGDTFQEMKPSPLPLQKVSHSFGISTSNAIMVGDSINDIQAGVAAGIVTIGCSWGYGHPDELVHASKIVDSCAELDAFLLTETKD